MRWHSCYLQDTGIVLGTLASNAAGATLRASLQLDVMPEEREMLIKAVARHDDCCVGLARQVI